MALDAMRRRPGCCLAVVALLGAGCGGADPPATGQARLQHTHGLGVDPRDAAVYVATHYGLFRAPQGSRRLEQVGTSTQDIMGFSVVGPGRFVGSGHPGPGQDLPPNLGLIASSDGGETWRSVSLEGDADFHVLRSSGGRIYGFDGTQGRLMVSRDTGSTWTQRTPPAPVIDLAIDPEDPDRIVASTERGVFVSPSSGEGWRPVNAEVGGLLAWPRSEGLLLVDGAGRVLRSDDTGASFRQVGEVGGPPAAFVATGGDLYVAAGDGTVQRSTDGGASWTVRAAP